MVNMCSAAQMPLREMETKMVRRECIASIIDILSAANSDDKEENLRRIKEEFNLKMSWSSSTVLKRLIALRRQLDIELGRKERMSLPKNLTLGDSEPKLKQVKVQLAKLPSILTAKFSTTSSTEKSATQLLKKSPPTLVAVLCKGKEKKKMPHNLGEKARKSVTWWDGYKNETLVNT